MYRCKIALHELEGLVFLSEAERGRRERDKEGGRALCVCVCTLKCVTGVNVCDVGVTRWMKEAENTTENRHHLRRLSKGLGE